MWENKLARFHGGSMPRFQACNCGVPELFHTLRVDHSTNIRMGGILPLRALNQNKSDDAEGNSSKMCHALRLNLRRVK